MLFNSLQFIFLFLPLTVIGFWAIAKHLPRSYALVFLSALSFIFYLWGEPTYPWLLFASIGLNYLFGRLIQEAGTRSLRTAIFAIGVATDLLILGYFKYSNFLFGQLSDAGLLHRAFANIALPIGISFFTFTQIAYLADSHRGKVVERSFLSYVLFVSFYPHLIAGPILHHSEMMPQFRAARAARPLIHIYGGLALFAIGLFKKVLIADPAGQLASVLFGNVSVSTSPSFFVAWIAALAYTAQIYFDFSGYSDMAIGISEAIGIKLPINFNSPYKSRSVIEFWRRWHITLSRFLRDYLYIPLGGNRHGKARRYFNLIVTMVLGGIWHGAGWTFLLWGALHGVGLFVAQIWQDLREKFALPAMRAGAAWTLTFAFVVFAWVPFRAPNLSVTAAMWEGMLGFNGAALPALRPLQGLIARFDLPSVPVVFSVSDLLILVPAYLIAFWAPNGQELLARFRLGLQSPGYRLAPVRSTLPVRLHFDLKTSIFIGAVLGLSIRAIGGYSEFIYFHF